MKCLNFQKLKMLISKYFKKFYRSKINVKFNFRNAEELLKFNNKTKNELQRQSNAEIKNDKTREILNDITKALTKFCNMFMVSN